mmetsp:Transcript_15257/g.43028  ORF Transcript_15257/g.43028 Transcript_15257/m.43028 type:complete len:1144 (+) Transcript_15257:332-3763(+)|eukprot:CAMPEP_0119551210 /NCGR_PEP_ID=MMETSP1352-20130426/4518_1 /TAXON_ID=265584 /ORGANISM="Stauroneis constricta, Strain CCMP1120" /LENGTH=1143 /DNA_ID=CAMNT_0007597227 /DNA_START=341 /DNA_END=3772 /DNA_ORIENTATION=+
MPSSRGRRTLGSSDAVVRSNSRRRQGGSTSRTNLSAGNAATKDYYESSYGTSKGGFDGAKVRRRLLFLFMIIVIIVVVVVHRTGRKNGGGSSSNSRSKRHSIDPLASFDLVSSATLEHLNVDATVYKHKNTGMQVMTMLQKTPSSKGSTAPFLQDGVFGISFRTIPQNSHGTAHVVSQAIQLGSKKFGNLKDPWNQIRQGSLQTYLDVNTKRDRTEYIVASRSAKDLGYSMEIMLDSFFQPNMAIPTHSWAFRQEGWRLEQTEDGKNIFLEGNAYNQAKIDQMHPEKYMNNYLFKKLFPDAPVHYNERGEQQEILKMTHDEVIEFWKKYYHPANAQALCYGATKETIHVCMSELHLHLEEFYPNKSENLIRENTIPPYQLLSPKFASQDRMPYASYRDDIDYRVVFSWAINENLLDHVSQLAWMVIEDMLLGNTATELAEVVTTEMWGDDIIGRLERDYQQWVMAIGVSGILTNEDASRVVAEMNDVLLKIVADGFPEDALTASMNKVEYKILNAYSDDIPRGADIFKNLMTNWNYDREPLAALDVKNHMKLLRQEVSRNGQQYFLDLMTLHLMDNQHKITLQMYPSTQVAQIHRDMEVKFLNDLNHNLKQSEGVALLKEATTLQNVQKTPNLPEDLAKIPRVHLSDVPTTGNDIPLKVDRDVLGSGVTVLEHRLPETGGLGYIEYAMDISGIDFDDIILLPFYCFMSTRTGNGDLTPAQFIRKIEGRTGGMYVEPLLEDIIPFSTDNGYYVPTGQHLITKLVVHGNSAVSNSASMFTLITEILMLADFYEERTAERLLRKLIDDMEDDIQENGNKYTAMRIESTYSLPGFVREKWHGVTQLYELRKILEDLTNGKWHMYAERFKRMRATILGGSRNGQFLSITADPDTLRGFTPAIRAFVTEGLPPITIGTPRFPDFSAVVHPWVEKGSQRMSETIASMHTNEAFVVPTRLSHVGKGGQVYDAGEKVSGSALTVTQFIEGFYFWNELATKGAHDATATIDIDSGMIVYQSAEDPSPFKTNEIYDNAASFVYNHVSRIQGDELPTDFQAAMIGAIAKLDGTTPQPNSAGFTSMCRFFRSETDSHRQKIREEIMGTTKAQANAMVERLSSWGNPRLVVVTNDYFYGVESQRLELTKCSLKDFSC